MMINGGHIENRMLLNLCHYNAPVLRLGNDNKYSFFMTELAEQP